MRNGRINERNIGIWTLDGEPKHLPKRKKLPEPNEDQEKVLKAVHKINDMLQSHKCGYYSFVRFDLSDDIIVNWFEKGIITKGIKESKYGMEPKEICILNEDNIGDLELSRNLMVYLFNLQPYL